MHHIRSTEQRPQRTQLRDVSFKEGPAASSMRSSTLARFGILFIQLDYPTRMKLIVKTAAIDVDPR